MTRLFALICLIIPAAILISCSNNAADDSTASGRNSSIPKEQPASLPQEETESTSSVDLDDLQQKYSENPDDYVVACELARKYESLGNTDEAKKIFERYFLDAESPHAGQARLEYALLLSRTGNITKAYDELLKITDEFESVSGEAYYQLGNFIAVGGFEPPRGDKIQLAVMYYKKSLEKEATNAIVYRRLADLMFAEGNIEEAREHLAIFLVVYPDDGLSWLDLADWSVKVRDFSKAKEYYERAIECGNREIKDKAKKSLARL